MDFNKVLQVCSVGLGVFFLKDYLNGRVTDPMPGTALETHFDVNFNLPFNVMTGSLRMTIGGYWADRTNSAVLCIQGPDAAKGNVSHQRAGDPR